MAAIVQSVGNDNGAGASTLVLTIASSGSGNLLGVCFEASLGGATITSVADNKSQAWTQALNFQTSGFIFTFPNTQSGVTTITITASAGGVQMCGIAFEISGMATSSVLDQSANNSQGGVTSWSSGTAPTTSQADYGVGFAFTQSSDTVTMAAGSGWTGASGTGITSGYRQQSGNCVIFLEYQEFASAGGYAATGTVSSALTMLSAIVLLKETLAGTTLMGAMCL